MLDVIHLVVDEGYFLDLSQADLILSSLAEVSLPRLLERLTGTA